MNECHGWVSESTDVRDGMLVAAVCLDGDFTSSDLEVIIADLKKREQEYVPRPATPW
jgi:hypothetical protein